MNIFLTRPTVKTETNIFLDRLPFNLKDTYLPRNPLICFHFDYNFAQINLYEIIKEGLKAAEIEEPIEDIEKKLKDFRIVTFPSINYSRPLNWPLLLHEIGHAVEDQINFADKMINDLINKGVIKRGAHFGKRKVITINWTTEVFADLFALRMLGPAYFTSFISYGLLKSSVIDPDEKHPSSDERVNILYDELSNEMGIKHDIINYFYNLFQQRKEIVPFYKPPEKCLSPLLDLKEIKKYVAVKVKEIAQPVFSEVNLNRAKELAHFLEEGILISSYRRKNAEKEINKRLSFPKDKDPEKQREKTKEIFKLFVEQPSDISEIINAMWLDYFLNVLPEFNKIFFQSGDISIDKKFDEYTKFLKHRENNVLKSIEKSFIHDKFKGIDD